MSQYSFKQYFRALNKCNYLPAHHFWPRQHFPKEIALSFPSCLCAPLLALVLTILHSDTLYFQILVYTVPEMICYELIS